VGVAVGAGEFVCVVALCPQALSNTRRVNNNGTMSREEMT
jgi:hypothetical protein